MATLISGDGWVPCVVDAGRGMSKCRGRGDSTNLEGRKMAPLARDLDVCK